MSSGDLLLAAGVVTVGAALQGAVGFGLALVSVPFLVMIDPLLVPGPLVFAALFLTLSMAILEREAIDYHGLVWGLVGRVPGTAAGAVALVAIPLDRMGEALGGLVLLAVLLSVSGLRLRPGPVTLTAAGVLSGFMGTISSIGGPPLALVYQHEVGARLRGTLAGYFVTGCVLSLVALAVVGRFGWLELRLSLALIPGILLGFVLSRRAVGWIDRGYTRPAVLAVSALAALLAIVREMF